MKHCKTFVVGLCVVTLVSGCATKQGTFTLGGGGAGAVIGGIVGNIIGKNTKGTMIGAAIGAAIGSGTGAIIGHHMDKVKAEAERVKNAKVEKAVDANGLDCVKVTFDSGILFPLNGSSLSDNAKNDLKEFSKVVIKNRDLDIAIQGYTDASGNDKINIPLSKKRAKAVSSFLNSNGVPSVQIRTVEGYGSANPVENKRISKANRRVEVYLYASKEMIEKANNNNL